MRFPQKTGMGFCTYLFFPGKINDICLEIVPMLIPLQRNRRAVYLTFKAVRLDWLGKIMSAYLLILPKTAEHTRSL